MRLDHIKIPWKRLEDALNYIVDGINANEPVEGSGIRISDGSRGKIIETSGGVSGGTGEKFSGVGWQPMAVIDTSSGTCVTKYIWYWGTAPADTQGKPPSPPS